MERRSSTPRRTLASIGGDRRPVHDQYYWRRRAEEARTRMRRSADNAGAHCHWEQTVRRREAASLRASPFGDSVTSRGGGWAVERAAATLWPA